MVDVTSLGPRIKDILIKSDLSTVTAKSVRKRLEDELGISLAQQKDTIDKIIMEQFYRIHEGASGSGAYDSDPTGGSQGRSSGKGRQAGAGETAGKKQRGRPPKEEKGRKKKRAKRVVDPDKPKRKTGLSKPMKLSRKLGTFFDRTYMPRTDVVKGLWKYIKEHNMQDPVDRRYILCDEKFKGMFETDRLYMYTMNKQLNDHLFKVDDDELPTATKEIDLHSPEEPVSQDVTQDSA
ncbi:Upstream activation factor subunit spp27 [Zancudomyces culisetae]|uniref:Upstream activation factor subunit spp27 n=1 Tax=Zancudomyces culisetae TaxID=1213189 RepID=A0A1R1PFF5_ZANCU|nr:Upstream activation factor subunit spp27 [Zancudomyces culisetae]|eukprot:OMH79701.1 Upstream activation factor subunit spp27 [Zancudomyces culisetae]